MRPEWVFGLEIEVPWPAARWCGVDDCGRESCVSCYFGVGDSEVSEWSPPEFSGGKAETLEDFTTWIYSVYQG